MNEENKPNEVATEQPTEPKADSLNNRDALKHALAQDQSDKPETAPEKVEVPTKQEVKQAVDADMEPPSGFSEQAKKAWREKDYKKVNEEYDRLMTGRLSELTKQQNRANRAEEEARVSKEFVGKVRNYLTIRGEENLPDEVKIVEALQLVNELKGSKPSVIKAELKKIGVDLDKEDDAATTNSIDPSLLNRISRLEKDLEDKQLIETTNLFGRSISSLASEQTRTGSPKYPGFHDGSETGIEFARELGSLTREPVFVRLVQRRFPNATHVDLVREAYIQLGGKIVDDSAVRVSKDNPKQIEKSRRAAASSPGGAVARGGSESLIGKLSNRAALKKAVELEQEH